MANIPYTDAEIREINDWRLYRDAQALPWSLQEVWNNYRIQNWIQPPAAPVRAHVVVAPHPQPLRQDHVPTPAQIYFMNSVSPELTNAAQGFPENWIGRKLLGEGGHGIVGLWEYTGPANNGPDFRQAVVKAMTGADPNNMLREEGRVMQALQRSSSRHVVSLLVDPTPVAPAEGGDPRWHGTITRLIMEYCPLGDSFCMIERFLSRGQLLREISLWRIFDCLIDGISVLEYGNELTYDVNGKASTKSRLSPWNKKIHFDLKPDNILLSEDRMSHPFTPIFKIGDFGITTDFDPSDHSPASNVRRVRLRRGGTPEYFAPEHFTVDWDTRDWTQSGGIACQYFATNVWGIGCIMYQILLLSASPDPTLPFTPTWPINGAPARGTAYGVNLHAWSQPPYHFFSNALTDLVQECLYEVPGNRPSLPNLKNRVKEGFEAAFAADPTPDNWTDFLPPQPGQPQPQAHVQLQPQVPAQAPAQAQAARRGRARVHSYRCLGYTVQNVRCRNKVRDPNNRFCNIHQNQRP